MSFVTILKGLAPLLTLGAVALAVLWATHFVARMAEEGEAMAVSLGVATTSFWAEGQEPNLFERSSLALLPVVAWADKNGLLAVSSQLGVTEESLIRAGMRDRLQPSQFLAWCWMTGLLAGGIALLSTAIFGLGFIVALLVVFPVAFLVGAVIPQMILRNYTAERVALIEKRLPFAIEFIVMAMDADPSLESAIKTYARQIPSDPLGAELLIVAEDIKFGKRQQDALLDMATRLRSGPISSFVLATNTGLNTGQGVKEALRIQANVTRERRFQAAEEIAKAASTRATFPLLIAAMAIVLLLVGPMVLKLSQDSLF